jgi:phosphatidate cytidylyltransferase
MISKNLKLRIYTSIALMLLFFLILISNFFFVFVLLVGAIFAFIEFSFNTLFIIYLSLFCFYFFSLSNYLFLKIIIFSILLSCIASDLGGFIFGKIIKGPKISKISPNKTFSGAMGSIVLSSLVFLSSIYFFTNNLQISLILIGTIISIASQIGDLFFSYLKRKAKVKDTGKFLPGHGGLLDRIDGILLGLPIGFITTLIFLT